MANANARFCQVDFLTYESTVQKNIHVLGDAIQVAPLMPKSGHMANQHGKVCAAAVVALLTGNSVEHRAADRQHLLQLRRRQGGVHVASVHAYDAREEDDARRSRQRRHSRRRRSEQEGVYGRAWARNIWADMLT